jgi:hypothetical protein
VQKNRKPARRIVTPVAGFPENYFLLIESVNLVRQQNRVNHVNDAVRLLNVRNRDLGLIALLVRQNKIFALHAGPQLPAAHGVQFSLAHA